jgi:dethiobiotin synthetase
LAALYITATGTDIGKTFVSLGLIEALRRRGRKVAALKPIVTGFDEKNFSGSDPALLLKACGQAPDLAAIAKIAPWRFAAPLSPDMAAGLVGKAIDIAALARFCNTAIAGVDDALLIEGIGGLMVPLDAKTTICDLIATLDIPMLLIAGTYLGSLSHTLSALEVAQKRGLPIAALVVNETQDSAVPIEAVCESLGHFWHGPIIALHRDPARHAAVFERLAELLPSPPASMA